MAHDVFAHNAAELLDRALEVGPGFLRVEDVDDVVIVTHASLSKSFLLAGGTIPSELGLPFGGDVYGHHSIVGAPKIYNRRFAHDEDSQVVP